MSLHRSDAIVLRSDRSGEASLLLAMFLRTEGRVNLLAKGARNPGSVLVGKLEPFAEIEVLYYQGDKDKLGIVSQVTEKRAHADLSGDIRRLSYASGVVEIVEGVRFSGEETSAMYELLARALYLLNYAAIGKLEFYFLAFLLKALDLIGLAPQLARCVKTGQPVEDAEVLFSVEDGGVISAGAADPQVGYFKLDRGTLLIMKQIHETEIDKLKNLNFTQNQKELLRELLIAFLSYHTDRGVKFQSLAFLEKLSKL